MISSLIKPLLRKMVSALLRDNDRWYELEPGISAAPARRRELKKWGFLASSDLIFDFAQHGYGGYANFRDYRKLHPINGSFSRLIDNKAFLPVILPDEREWFPEFTAAVENGRLVYSLNPGFPNLDDALAYGVARFGELVARPGSSSGGKGIFLVDRASFREGFDRIRRNRGTLVLTNRLAPEAYSKEIFPGSLNTIRVLFVKGQGGEMKVVKTLHRFGTHESAPLDNCSQGGMLFPIELETGCLGEGIIYGSQTANGRYLHHVDTLQPVRGRTIPGWQAKLARVQKLVERLSFLCYGGMDIAPTEAGLKLLEINSLPSLRLCQFDSPLLLCEEVRHLFAERGYPFG
jgi:hypothetical protein